MTFGSVSGSPAWQNLILITGHRRSGSTWLAAALGSAEEAELIPFEPLWLTHQPESPQAGEVRRWRQSYGWYIPFNVDSPVDREYRKVLVEHLIWLCRHYCDGPVDTLVIKEPHPNWLEFMLAAFQPDKVIYLKRHPLGIVNSYDEHGLYHRWGVESEWKVFCQELPTLLPELVSLSEFVSHPAEKVAFMDHACDLLQEKILDGVPHRVVGYEALCLEPEDQFSHLYNWLGWAWDKKVWQRVIPFISPEADNIESGFVDVRKYSAQRAYAWRKELAPHLISRVHRLFIRIGLGVPFPDSGLPGLCKDERKMGRIKYLRRRRAYLRRLGFQAFMHSL